MPSPSPKIRPPKIDVPETEETTRSRVSCDGGGGALGHPRVFLTIGPQGWVECPYCDKRFVLKTGPAGLTGSGG